MIHKLIGLRSDIEYRLSSYNDDHMDYNSQISEVREVVATFDTKEAAE